MIMKGKKGVVLGVANQRSIAWGITQSLLAQGADVAVTCLNEKNKMTLQKLLKDHPEVPILECDVTKPETIESTFAALKEQYGEIDFMVHCLAFADKTDLDGGFINTSLDGFNLANDISAYSLVSLTKAAEPIMSDTGSIVALTYLGAEKIVTNYNVMGVAKAALECSVRYLANDLGGKGIRVNAISAGPIKTLAARGISNFSNMLKVQEKVAPLKRANTIEEVGDVAMFLCSDLSRGISAETMYVDGGFNAVGLGPINAYNLD
ncbi:MAG: enoyl-ACP reductase [Lentisphaerales bacterium]|nr:enoyl-ACP reductase [Lentisphaerales bacterium]